LQEWCRWLRDKRRRDHAVYVYFDNDQKSAAPKDAKRLLELCLPGRSKSRQAVRNCF
jgi:uncharacterized protein YecE (DUF72 family)